MFQQTKHQRRYAQRAEKLNGAIALADSLMPNWRWYVQPYMNVSCTRYVFRMELVQSRKGILTFCKDCVTTQSLALLVGTALTMKDLQEMQYPRVISTKADVDALMTDVTDYDGKLLLIAVPQQ